MTLTITSKTAGRIKNPTGERMTMPSELETPDALAVWDFYTLGDSMGLGHDLTPGPSAVLPTAGAVNAGTLKLGSGANAYALIADLPLPAIFTLIVSVTFGAGSGSIFGNSTTTTSGFRLYSSATQLLAKAGDDTGRAVLNVTPAGPMEIGVSYNAGAITLCTVDQVVTSNDTSPLGAASARFGSQELAAATAASGLTLHNAALYGVALTLTQMRDLMVLARAKRLSDA